MPRAAAPPPIAELVPSPALLAFAASLGRLLAAEDEAAEDAACRAEPALDTPGPARSRSSR